MSNPRRDPSKEYSIQYSTRSAFSCHTIKTFYLVEQAVIDEYGRGSATHLYFCTHTRRKKEVLLRKEEKRLEEEGKI